MIEKFSMYMKENKGYAAMVGSIIALVVAIIMISSVVMPTVKATNTVGWTAAEIALWGVLGILIIVSLYQILGTK